MSRQYVSVQLSEAGNTDLWMYVLKPTDTKGASVRMVLDGSGSSIKNGPPRGSNEIRTCNLFSSGVSVGATEKP
jgi:hypothetical protein